jgi:alkylmercury lyase
MRSPSKTKPTGKTMAEHPTCTEPGFLRRFPWSELAPYVIRLLAAGEPVRIGQIASAAGVAPAEVDAMLSGQPGTDWDEQGRLVGFGLTQRPTAHRFTVAGRRLYTWCAMDTLFFPLLLGERAIAESRCPATGRSIHLEVEPEAVISVDPEHAVVSRIGAGRVSDVRAEVCDHGHFFASAEAAHEWAQRHRTGLVSPVREAFEQARRTWLAETAGTH